MCLSRFHLLTLACAYCALFSAFESQAQLQWPASWQLEVGTSAHVAGYSDDGKWLGTRMVYEAFCRWAALEPEPPEPPGQIHELAIQDASDPVLEALEAACFVHYHDREMRDLLPLSPQNRSAGFDRLRRDYPRRRDFKAWRIEGPADRAAEILQTLGFQVESLKLPPGA